MMSSSRLFNSDVILFLNIEISKLMAFYLIYSAYIFDEMKHYWSRPKTSCKLFILYWSKKKLSLFSLYLCVISQFIVLYTLIPCVNEWINLEWRSGEWDKPIQDYKVEIVLLLLTEEMLICCGAACALYGNLNYLLFRGELNTLRGKN
jgi:hypothetical protein